MSRLPGFGTVRAIRTTASAATPTGSAAGPLAAHLARHGSIAFGQWIEILQGVEIGRPSTMRAKAEGTREQLEAVAVAGSAVVVAHGTLHV